MLIIKYNKKGFTLIELIITLSIVSVLLLIIVPKYRGEFMEDVYVSQIVSNYEMLKDATNRYMVDTGSKPSTGSNGVGFVSEPNSFGMTDQQYRKLLEDWNGPYIKEWINNTNDYGSTYSIFSIKSLRPSLLEESTVALSVTKLPYTVVEKLEEKLDSEYKEIGNTSVNGLVRYVERPSGWTVFLILYEDRTSPRLKKN